MIRYNSNHNMINRQHDFGADKTITTTMEWSSSLINLLRIGHAPGEKVTYHGFKEEDAENDTISTICLVVDNAKAHRSMSDSSCTATTSPSSSLNDTDDYRDLLESLFEDDGCGEDDWGRAHNFHNSYPAPTPPRAKKCVHSTTTGTSHLCRWGSSSDPEIGRLTLDDMLREDEVSRRNVPRPVRQRSLEGPTFDRLLAEHHENMKDHCPTLVQRQSTLSFDGL